MKKIKISSGSISLEAELYESATSDKIWEALPLEGQANRWGDEIFFEIPVAAEQEPEACEDVHVGMLGYWPTGHAFCIFFGPTPASRDEQPRAASPVNVFGQALGDATAFREVQDGMIIKIERS